MDNTKDDTRLAYFHQKIAFDLALKLLYFGFYQYKKIAFIENYNEFKGFIENKTLTSTYFAEKFVFSYLTDSIKFAICFENFLKAKLLINGVLIHCIDYKLNEELSKLQNKEPIFVIKNSVNLNWTNNLNFNEENLMLFVENNLKEIQFKTISLDLMLKPKYKNLLKIDDNILNIVKPYIKYRNNLHLYYKEEKKFDTNSLKDILTFTNFVNDSIVNLHNNLSIFFPEPEKYHLDRIILE